MNEKVFRTMAECNPCRGTGLYVGLAERDGAAVVCHTCKGSGEREIVVKYHDFTGRKTRPNVQRVYQAGCGIVIGENRESGYLLEDFGGMPYADWKAGQPFPEGSEMRRFTCPAWWYQSTDYKKKPDWPECEIGDFSGCSHFPDKHRCWERSDKELLVQLQPTP